MCYKSLDINALLLILISILILLISILILVMIILDLCPYCPALGKSRPKILHQKIF